MRSCDYSDNVIEHVPDSRALGQLLRNRTHAILAPVSGGCTRYIFSEDVPFTVSPEGHIHLLYDSANPSHHDLLSHSGLSLRLLLDCDAEGVEQSHLVLIGRIEPDGAPAAPAAATRYRFRVQTAQVEFASGRSVPVSLPG